MSEIHRVAVQNAEAPAALVSKRRGMKIKNVSNKSIAAVIVIIILLAAVAVAGVYYNRYHNSQKELTKLKNNPQVVAQNESHQLISSIGKLTVLPVGEKPTVATVTDTTKLADQPFFANAQNGDKVLIYTTAKKAFLYRPSTNKIINIAPVNLGSGTATTNPSTSKTTTGQ